MKLTLVNSFRNKILPNLPNVLSVMGGSISTSLANLLVSVLIIQREGIEFYGKFILVLSAYYIFYTLTKPLTHLAIIKNYPSCNSKSLIKLSFLTEFICWLISLPFLIIFLLASGNDILTWLFISLSVIVINNGTLLGITRSLGQFINVSLVIFISSLSKVFIAYYFDSSPENLAIMMIAFEMFLWIAFLLLSRRVFLPQNINFPNVSTKGFIEFSLWASFHEILDLPVKYLDRLIIGKILGPVSVAAFDIARKISQVVAHINVPLTTVIFPYFSKLINNEKNIEIKFMTNFSIVTFIFLSILLIPFFTTFYELINHEMFGSKISEYNDITLSFILIQILALSFFWVHPLSLNCVSMKKISLILIFSNLIYLLSLVIICYFIGLDFIYLSFTIQVILVIFLKFYLINHYISLNN